MLTYGLNPNLFTLDGLLLLLIQNLLLSQNSYNWQSIPDKTPKVNNVLLNMPAEF